jgi:hypothetical protein
LTYFLASYLAFTFYLTYFLTVYLAFYLVYLWGFFAAEVRRRRRRIRRGGTADIKSNNPHLTCGEKHSPYRFPKWWIFMDFPRGKIAKWGCSI